MQPGSNSSVWYANNSDNFFIPWTAYHFYCTGNENKKEAWELVPGFNINLCALSIYMYSETFLIAFHVLG